MSKNLEKVWSGLSKQRIAALHARSLQNPESPVSKKFLAWHGTQEGGMSIGQSKKLVVADKTKQKEREKLSLKTVGATKGLAVGGEHGGAGIAQKSGEVKVYTPAEIEAMNKERGTMPVQLSPEEKRKNMIKAAFEKAAAKKARSFDVPTMKPQTAEVQDLIDAHRSRHYTMDEEVEQIDEAFDKSSPAHAKAQELVSNYGNRSAARAVYHGDGSATIHTTGDKKVSSATRVDHIHDQAGLGYNRSAEAYKNSSKSKGGLKFKTKETEGKSIYGSHEIHISHKGMKEEVEQIDEASKENKAKKNAYMRLKGLKAMKAGKIDPARGHSPTRFGREMLKKEEAELYEEPKDAADEGEYDYEGDMAKSQLRSIMFNAKRMHDMLEDNTNLPEWVQSKITLAEDYISTAANYMQGEMNEENITEAQQATVAIDPDVAYKSGEADVEKKRAYQRALEKQQRERVAKGRREKLQAVTKATDLDVASRRLVKARQANPALAAAQAELSALSPQTKAEQDVVVKAAEKRAREAAAAAAKQTPATVKPKVRGRLGALIALAQLGKQIFKKTDDIPVPTPPAAPTASAKPKLVAVPKPTSKPAEAPKPAPKPVAAPKPAPKPEPAPAPMPLPVPVPKPAAKPEPAVVAIPTSAPMPTPIPVPQTARAGRTAKKPLGFPLMYPGKGQRQRPAGLKFHRGADVEYFPRSFEYGEVPKGYEFNSYDPTIESSGEPIAEGKALPGLSNLVSTRKNKLAKLKASKAAPVKEESDQDTSTDKYLENRRAAIREAIMSKTTNKNGK